MPYLWKVRCERGSGRAWYCEVIAYDRYWARQKAIALMEHDNGADMLPDSMTITKLRPADAF